MTTPLERLQGIQDKFQKAIDPALYIQSRPQAAPGFSAPQIKIGGPEPGLQLLKGIGKNVGRGLGIAGTAYAGYEVGSDLLKSLQRGEGYAAIPGLVKEFLSGPKADVAPGGRQYMPPTPGYQPRKPTGFLKDKKPGDPQTKVGPVTKIGGGNAGGAQSVNPDATGYIPPTGKPAA